MSDTVLVGGESLSDIVRGADGSTTEVPGGSAANVAVALARLERPVRFATSWGDDERGRVLSEWLARDRVELATDPYAVAHTSTALATLGSDGKATYEFDLAWRLNGLAEGPPPVAVHVCSLGAVLPPGVDDVVAILEGLRSVATVSYDVNARPAITGTGPELVARVETVAALSDVVKASDEDLAVLYGEADPVVSAKRLLALGPAAVVITRGPDGATWVTAQQEVHVAAVPVVVADTIAAGDTFCAGLLDALWTHDLLGAAHRAALQDAPRNVVVDVLAHAARAAAVTVGRPGADPPYRRELD
jgi:fructokinase